MNTALVKPCVAEFIGTFTLIFVGVGAIYQNAGLLAVAFAHGLAIAVMVSATGAISGGHLNPAVSFGLWVGGKIDLPRLAAYWVAQLLGAVAAAFLLLYVFAQLPNQVPSDIVAKGTPDLLREGISSAQGIVIEGVLTFFLVFVVYGTAVDGRAPKLEGRGCGPRKRLARRGGTVARSGSEALIASSTGQVNSPQADLGGRWR